MTPSSNVQTLVWTRRDFAEIFQRMLRDRYEDVGREIRRLREAQGYSQEELAARADLSAKTVSRIESPPPQGHHEIRGKTFRKIADALGVTVEHLRRPLVAPITLSETPAELTPADGEETVAALEAELQQEAADEQAAERDDDSEAGRRAS